MKIPVNVSWSKAALVSLGLVCACAAGPASEQTPAPAEVRGHTAPSEKRVQNFDLPGIVQQMFVKEGDVVKSGQVIAQQNIAPDEAHLQSLEFLADSTRLEIEAEKAQLKKDKADLTRKTDLKAKNAIAVSDWEQAELQVEVDSLKVDHASKDEEHARADVQEEKARIEQKKLMARIDGIISEINVHEGELATNSNDPQKPGAITIVKNDPLYVEVQIPSDLVRQLQKDWKSRTLQVQYVDDNSAWHDAKIHFIKPEADPESNTNYVQLEMPNPEGRSSGLWVTVRIPGVTASPAGVAANAGQ